MIEKSGELAVSVLTESSPFWLFELFGFTTGSDSNKFESPKLKDVELVRCQNGLLGLMTHTSAVMTGKVVATLDCGTHTVFFAEVTQAQTVSSEPSLTYSYYFEHIKPKPAPKPPVSDKTVWICKICNYEYEGESLPSDYICPLCKHGASDFEKA